MGWFLSTPLATNDPLTRTPTHAEYVGNEAPAGTGSIQAVKITISLPIPAKIVSATGWTGDPAKTIQFPGCVDTVCASTPRLVGTLAARINKLATHFAAIGAIRVMGCWYSPRRQDRRPETPIRLIALSKSG